MLNWITDKDIRKAIKDLRIEFDWKEENIYTRDNNILRDIDNEAWIMYTFSNTIFNFIKRINKDYNLINNTELENMSIEDRKELAIQLLKLDIPIVKEKFMHTMQMLKGIKWLSTSDGAWR